MRTNFYSYANNDSPNDMKQRIYYIILIYTFITFHANWIALQKLCFHLLPDKAAVSKPTMYSNKASC